MKSKTLVGPTVAVALSLLTPAALQAQDLRGEIDAVIKDYLANHPDEVGAIVKDYLIRHPEAVGEIMASVLKRKSLTAENFAVGSKGSSAGPGNSVAKVADERSAAIESNATQLFSSSHQVTLGNPDGDVTLTEFFDYSCGYCKRALPDTIALLRDDPKLKVVLKEFPILGPGSVDAAHVAVAVRMQDPTGQKYLAFHEQLLAAPGSVTMDKAMAAAKAQGLDMTRLEKDMASDEVNTTISEDLTLARAVGISGTPSYVVGKTVLVGAVGLNRLKSELDASRSHSEN